MLIRSAIVPLLVVGTALSAAPAQPVRDLLVLNGQHYVRSQQVPHGADISSPAYTGVSAFAGGCALVCCSNAGSGYTYLRHFDRWANPLHNEVIVDVDWSWNSRDCYVNGYGAETWVTWDTEPTNPFGRVFDQLGESVSETFSLVNPPPPYYHPRFFALAEAGGAVTIEKTVQDSRPHADLYLRRFSPEGEALSDLLPVATSRYLSEFSTGIAPLPDGGQVIGYSTVDFSSPEVRRGYLRRVRTDQSMDPAISVSDEQVRSVTPRLLSDGTLLVQYVHHPLGAGVSVQRYDADVVPLGDPVAVDADLDTVAAASDGSLVLAADTSTGDHIWMRLYDANGQPVGERFEPMDDPTPCRLFPYGSQQPVAYADDGTIWVAWDDCDEADADYLTTLTPFEPGDMNYDRRVDNFDITPFVMALADPAEYQAHYPGLPYQFLGDVNEDGAFDNFDISPFVQLLTSH